MLMLLGLTFPGVAAAAVDCGQVLNMVNLNIPTDIVVQTMKDSGTKFTADDVKCLADGGAPEPVLAQARVMSGAAAAAATTPGAGGSAPAPASQSAFDSSETLGGATFTPGAAAEEPGPEELEPAEASPAEVELAVEEFRAGRYQTCSSALHDMSIDGRYPDQESKIEYYLAKCLQGLNLQHSAQHYYLEVVRKGPSNPFFKFALFQMVAIAKQTGNDYELTRVVTKIPPESFPRQARNDLFYLMGRELYERDELSQASDYFSQVSPKSDLYIKAQYYEGVINQERGKLRTAVLAFREVYKADPPLQGDAKLARRIEDMKDLALINIARVYYGLQRLENAATYYEDVSRDSTYWPQSLFERAWVTFSTNDLNETLGLLLTVDSPYFSDTEFIPEVTILRALTWFYLCEHEDVERTLLEFDREHQPMKDEMEAFVKQYGGQKELWDKAYDAYFVNEHPDSTLTAAVFARVLRNRDLAMLVEHLDLMDAEIAVINAQKAQWKDTIGQTLLRQYEEDRIRYKKKAGDALVKEMNKLVDILDNLLLQSEVLRFEVVDAQRADYEFRAKGAVVVAGDERKIDFAVDPRIIYWPFNGEFWRDELGYYRYTEHGSCN